MMRHEDDAGTVTDMGGKSFSIQNGGAMRLIRIGSLLCLVLLCSGLERAQGAVGKNVTLMLGGQYCDLYLTDVESALKKLEGVATVDLKSMKGHAIVTIAGDKTTVNHLIQAVNAVKGDGWHCRAQEMK
jgi:periplasmic mercuric ion binding protein